MTKEQILERLQALEAERARLKEEFETLTRADDITAEQQERLNVLIGETDNPMDKLDDEQRQLEKALKAHERFDNVQAVERGDDRPPANVRQINKRDVFDRSTAPGFGPERAREMRDRAIEAIERSGDFAEDAHKHQATKLVERLGHQNMLGEQILMTSDPEYRDAFYKVMTGEEYALTTGERAKLQGVRDLTRALALSSVTGVLVPSFLDPTVILTNDGSVNPFRAACRVESITTNVWTGVTSAGITGGWTGAEGSEFDDDAPSFANPPVTAYMADAFVPISYQAYEDLRGREGEIVAIIADYKDNLEATAFATGSGSNQPTGLVTALDANTNVELQTVTDNVFGLVDVYTTYENLPARYRNARTSWFANLAIINDIRQFGTDSLSTQTVDLTADGLTRVLGKSFYESSAMDGTIAAATKDNILVVGDPVNYLIADRVGLMVEFIPNLFGKTNARPTGQRGWAAHWRVGADSINDLGFRLLQAST